MASALIEADLAEGKAVSVLPVGKKALEYCNRRGYEIYSALYPEADDLGVSDCFTMARSVCKEFLAGKFDEVYLAFTSFGSILTQTPAVMKLLPLPAPEKSTSGEVHQLTMYEPDADAVFDAIIPEYLGGLIYGALCESLASELGARRTAMDAATKNAEEMIDDLNLKYNQARQSAITQEITEIIAGADA